MKFGANIRKIICILTLFQTIYFLGSPKLKEFADDFFKFDENGEKFSRKRGEKIARYEQSFSFFPGVSKGLVLQTRHVKTRLVWEQVSRFRVKNGT